MKESVNDHGNDLIKRRDDRPDSRRETKARQGPRYPRPLLPEHRYREIRRFRRAIPSNWHRVPQNSTTRNISSSAPCPSWPRWPASCAGPTRGSFTRSSRRNALWRKWRSLMTLSAHGQHCRQREKVHPRRICQLQGRPEGILRDATAASSAPRRTRRRPWNMSCPKTPYHFSFPTRISDATRHTPWASPKTRYFSGSHIRICPAAVRPKSPTKK